MQCAGCTVACDGMFLWCVQEVAELKEEDIISHTATVTQLPKASAVAVIDGISRTLSESYLEKHSIAHMVHLLYVQKRCMLK